MEPVEKPKRSREPITLETVVPAMPSKSERLSAPNETEHEAKLLAIDEKIKQLQTKREAQIKLVREKREGGRVEKSDVSAKNYVNERVAKRKEAIVEKKTLQAESEDIKNRNSLIIDQQRQLKARIKIFDASQIEPEIQRMTRQIETSTLTLQQEKKLVNELKELEASKPYVEQFHIRSQQYDHNKARLVEIRARIAELNQLIDVLSDEIGKVTSKVKESRDKLNTEIPEIEAEIDALKEEINNQRNLKRDVIKAFEDKKLAYQNQQRLIKQIEFIVQKKAEIVEREERKKAWEERVKEEEANKPEPWYAQIRQCDNYISYLEKLVPAQASSEESKAVEAEANLLPSKEERLKAESQAYFGSVGKGKKKKDRVRQRQVPAENALLNLPLDLLNFLSYTSIKAPYTLAEVPACVQSLKDKRQWYKTNPEEQEAPQTKQRTVKPEETKTTSSLTQEEFPQPEVAKDKPAYGIFEVQLPTKPVLKAERGGKRGRRGGK